MRGGDQNVWAEKISMSCICVEFAQCMLSKSHLNLKQRVTVDGKVYETETTMAEILAGAFYPFGEDNDAEIPIVDKDLFRKNPYCGRNRMERRGRDIVK